MSSARKTMVAPLKAAYHSPRNSPAQKSYKGQKHVRSHGKLHTLAVM